MLGDLSPRGEEDVAKFYEWLLTVRGISRETARDYVNYLKKPLDLNNKHSVYAYRLYYRYRGLEPPKELKPLRKTKPDLRVPSESEVLKTLTMIDSERIRQVYLVMLQSGLRLSHACFLLNNIGDLHAVELGGYYRIDLNLERGKKRAWVAYLLKIPPVTRVAANWVSNYAHRLPVKPKYIRKFVVTKLHEVGIESDVVRFMVGHSGGSDVHVLSYYDRLAKADKEYARYAEWLRQFLGRAGVVF